MNTTELDLPLPPGGLDLRQTTTLQQLGRYDPTAVRGDAHFIKAHHVVGDDGQEHIVRHALRVEDGRLRIRVKGYDVERMAQWWRDVWPPDDGLDAFVPHHPRVERWAQAYPGLRLVPVPWAFDVAVGAVLQQRVEFGQACGAFRRLANRHAAQAGRLRVLPGPKAIAAMQPWQLEALEIDPKRSRALIALAREEQFRPFVATRDITELRRRLLATPGIGPWTTEMVAGFAAADPDAVPPGDVSLPHAVCRQLADEPRGTDERMFELLEPWRGHRFRVVRLLWAANPQR